MKREDKHLEKFVDKLMSQQKLEQPSVDFEAVIMSKINRPVDSKVFAYQPLISKRAWLVITAIISLIVASVYFGSSPESTSLLEQLNLPEFKFSLLDNINFKWSKPLIYAGLALTAMLGLQVPLLKAYHSRQMKF